MEFIKNKIITSWILYDFANSSYSAVISAVIFPVYYTQIVVGNEAGLGDLWWGRAMSLSMAIVAFLAPLLGGIADYGGLRKRLLVLFTLVCVSLVALLSLIKQGMVVEGFILIVLANISMEASLIFYNSFLPRIASIDYIGRISSWGFMFGYMGSIISLLISIPLVNLKSFNIIWFLIAIFFLLFSIPTFIFLPQDERRKNIIESSMMGFGNVFNTIKELFFRKKPIKFLLAYLVYEDGVNTIIVFSSIFAATSLGFSVKELIILYLGVQFTAFLGALIFAKPTDLWGPKTVIIISLLLWITVSLSAFFIYKKIYFWIVAILAGTGLGTIQSASRAFYARIIPKGKEAGYFGLYALVGKSSAILGPYLFGYVSSTFGNQRIAVLSVLIFFITGLLILLSIKENKVIKS